MSDKNISIIVEELENFGCKLSNVNHFLLTFIDDTRRIGIDVHVYPDDRIWFHVFLTGGITLETIFQSNIIPFNNRKSELLKIKNILNKNHQLYKQHEQYRGALKVIQNINVYDTLLKEFESHFL